MALVTGKSFFFFFWSFCSSQACGSEMVLQLGS